MEKTEYEFPDPDTEAKNEPKVKAEGDDLELEIVDDTPPADRGRKPGEPPEEVSDEELNQYSDKVRKRLQHFTKGYHDERRAKEAALREREEAIRLAETVLEENKRLKGTVNKNQEALVEQAKKAVELELEQAKKAYKEAYESGDADAVVAAQEAFTTAKVKAERVANFQITSLQENETEVQPPQIRPTQEPAVSPKVARWQKNNPWFGVDDEMTSLALGLHSKMIKEGVDPESDTYYERLDSRMRQLFPERFDSDDGEELAEPTSTKTRQKANVVAPATRSTAPKKIVLTQSQVSIAKRLGVPLELYAKQVAEEMRKQNG